MGTARPTDTHPNHLSQQIQFSHNAHDIVEAGPLRPHTADLLQPIYYHRTEPLAHNSIIPEEVWVPALGGQTAKELIQKIMDEYDVALVGSSTRSLTGESPFLPDADNQPDLDLTILGPKRKPSNYKRHSSRWDPFALKHSLVSGLEAVHSSLSLMYVPFPILTGEYKKLGIDISCQEDIERFYSNCQTSLNQWAREVITHPNEFTVQAQQLAERITRVVHHYKTSQTKQPHELFQMEQPIFHFVENSGNPGKIDIVINDPTGYYDSSAYREPQSQLQYRAQVNQTELLLEADSIQSLCLEIFAQDPDYFKEGYASNHLHKLLSKSLRRLLAKSLKLTTEEDYTTVGETYRHQSNTVDLSQKVGKRIGQGKLPEDIEIKLSDDIRANFSRACASDMIWPFIWILNYNPDLTVLLSKTLSTLHRNYADTRNYTQPLNTRTQNPWRMIINNMESLHNMIFLHQGAEFAELKLPPRPGYDGEKPFYMTTTRPKAGPKNLEQVFAIFFLALQANIDYGRIPYLSYTQTGLNNLHTLIEKFCRDWNSFYTESTVSHRPLKSYRNRRNQKFRITLTPTGILKEMDQIKSIQTADPLAPNLWQNYLKVHFEGTGMPGQPPAIAA